METIIARRNDDVDSIVSREAVRLAYGLPDSPYSRVPEFAYGWQGDWRRHGSLAYGSCPTAKYYFGIYGDFDPEDDGSPASRGFRFLAKRHAGGKLALKFNPAPPSIYFVSKDDVNQSSIQMVSLGIKRNDPGLLRSGSHE